MSWKTAQSLANWDSWSPYKTVRKSVLLPNTGLSAPLPQHLSHPAPALCLEPQIAAVGSAYPSDVGLDSPGPRELHVRKGVGRGCGENEEKVDAPYCLRELTRMNRLLSNWFRQAGSIRVQLSAHFQREIGELSFKSFPTLRCCGLPPSLVSSNSRIP